MGNSVARVSPDPLDRPRITRSTSNGLARILSDKLRPHSESPRPHSIALPRPRTFARAPAHPSDKLRPLSPALGRPTPIQPFPNPDMDGINRHSTTTQPSFGSNTRTTRFRLNLPTSLIRQLQPILNNNSTSTTKRKARQICRDVAGNPRANRVWGVTSC